MPIQDFSLEQIKDMCKNSSTTKELARKLGYNGNSGFYRVRKFLNENGIDFSHFKTFCETQVPVPGIYKITNMCNGKVYIGQSINTYKRISAHKNSPFNPNSHNYDLPLYRAIRKYGIDNFKFEVIEKCERELLNEKEVYWIKFYDSTDPDKGYNIATGGEENQHGVLLTREQANEIKKTLMETSLSFSKIAKPYNVNPQTVSDINSGKTWNFGDIKYPIREVVLPKKEKVFCIDCGAEIHYRSTRCKKCYDKFFVKTSKDVYKFPMQIRKSQGTNLKT